jgi:hypothetical protein
MPNAVRLLIALVTLAGLGLPASAESRIALVIGNGAYKNAGVLRNPANDARRMAEALGRVGFEVMAFEDLDQTGMKRAVRDFAERLEAAGRDTVGLLFYAGHGVQVSGVNYFIPVDAEIDKESDVAIESISADDVMVALANARNRLNIVILDACRNNPFARSFRTASRGLARLDAPVGSLVAFSTAPGQVAADGDGDNSPYTTALVDVLAQPSMKIEDVFKRVRERVYASSGGLQVPWESSSILGDFYFSGDQASAELPPSLAPMPAPETAVATPAAAPTTLVFKMPRASAVCSDAPDGFAYCVSSVLAPSTAASYGPGNLFDGRADTAWVEGAAAGNGEGEMVTLTFPRERLVEGLRLVSGYNKSKRLFDRNSRPSRLRVTFSEGTEFEWTLEDRMGPQTIQLETPVPARAVTVEVLGVYAGSKYTDTAISELGVLPASGAGVAAD